MRSVIKRFIYKLFKKVGNNIFLVNIANFLYIRILPYLNNTNKPCKYKPRNINFELKDYKKNKDIRSIKVAFVCDDMTYKSFQFECNAVFLTPHNWLSTILEFNPDIFFCESTWSGIKEYEDSWRGRVYKNNKLKFENRRELIQILDYCKNANIKTVFWNKEDPVFFDHTVYNFTDTALKFDYIFTTAKECIEKYKNFGHKNVNLLMFGFSPKLFNPLGGSKKDDTAIFAGSWYSDQVKRCNDMNRIFNKILEKDIDLKIYNRYFNSPNPVNTFPEIYIPYINEGINFEVLSKVIKKAKYAININTVTDSETMFARRVFETMACNTFIISNYSVGIDKIFGDNVWFDNMEFSQINVNNKCKENIDIVFKHHTYEQRFTEILSVTGIPYLDNQKQIKIIYKSTDKQKCIEHFEKINWSLKSGYIFNDDKVISISNGEIKDFRQFCNISESGYFIIVDLETISDFKVENAVQHFSYIDNSIGIKMGPLYYDIISDNININTLFSVKMMKNILDNKNYTTKKYLI